MALVMAIVSPSQPVRPLIQSDSYFVKRWSVGLRLLYQAFGVPLYYFQRKAAPLSENVTNCTICVERELSVDQICDNISLLSATFSRAASLIPARLLAARLPLLHGLF